MQYQIVKKSQLQKSVNWDNRFDCKLSNIKGKYYISNIDKNQLHKLEKSNPDLLKNIKINKKIIFSLPALYTLENMVAAPHIDYYATDDLKENFKIKLSF